MAFNMRSFWPRSAVDVLPDHRHLPCSGLLTKMLEPIPSDRYKPASRMLETCLATQTPVF
jgi:hypothetical protein